MVQIKKSTVDKIIFSLEKNNISTTSSISKNVGISRTTATVYMAELEKRGTVCRERAGSVNLWRLTKNYKVAEEIQELSGRILEVIDCGGVGCMYPKTSTYGKAILKLEVKSTNPQLVEYHCSLGNDKCRELKSYAAQQKLLSLLK